MSKLLAWTCVGLFAAFSVMCWVANGFYEKLQSCRSERQTLTEAVQRQNTALENRRLLAIANEKATSEALKAAQAKGEAQRARADALDGQILANKATDCESAMRELRRGW